MNTSISDFEKILQAQWAAVNAISGDRLRDSYEKAGLIFDREGKFSRVSKDGVVVAYMTPKFSRKALYDALIGNIQNNAKMVGEILSEAFKGLKIPNGYRLDFYPDGDIRDIKSFRGHEMSARLRVVGNDTDLLRHQINVEFRTFLDRPQMWIDAVQGPNRYMENKPLLSDKEPHVYAETYEELAAAGVSIFNEKILERSGMFRNGVEITSLDRPGALRFVYQYTGALLEGDKPSKNPAEWKHIGTHEDGYLADKQALEVCEQGYFTKILSVGEYSPELEHVLNHFSPSVEEYQKAHFSALGDLNQGGFPWAPNLMSVKESGITESEFHASNVRGVTIQDYSNSLIAEDYVATAMYRVGMTFADEGNSAVKVVGIADRFSFYDEAKAYANELIERVHELSPPGNARTIPLSHSLSEKLDRDSYEKAVQIASGHLGIVVANDQEEKSYLGRVLDVTDLHAIQNLGGGNVVIHGKRSLDILPVKDALVTVAYDGLGHGVVTSAEKVQGKDLSR